MVSASKKYIDHLKDIEDQHCAFKPLQQFLQQGNPLGLEESWNA